MSCNSMWAKPLISILLLFVLSASETISGFAQQQITVVFRYDD